MPNPPTQAAHDPVALELWVRGAVQGVGFRPFVYRLAAELGLNGRVRNDTHGVHARLEGPRGALESLLGRLPLELPPLAAIRGLEHAWRLARGSTDLRIAASRASGAKTAVVQADAATCSDCLGEIIDPADRRFGYPFGNCTHCGPRFSIIEGLPYDRAYTTMRHFAMCPACTAEYGDPCNRRFHAQPNACPECGPQVELVDGTGALLAAGSSALDQSADQLAVGRILALKGLGGFQLLVDARNEAALARLRRRKARPHKPLAVMAADITMARALCRLDAAQERLLQSAAAPIVLARRLENSVLAQGVAPDNPWVGLMLPTTPLHHLLLGRLGFPVVATSGNLSDEPICMDNDDARRRLGHLADGFLLHDRPIARHVDDSVARVVDGTTRYLRRARGIAPLPIALPGSDLTTLAVGGHLKNTIALGIGGEVFVSQHIGDMGTPRSIEAFERVIADFLRLYEARPGWIVHDLHPDYATTRWARTHTAELPASAARAQLAGVRRLAVQHHHAHLAACLADNQVSAQALGVIWDGTGYGSDGSIWGGEFLLGDARAVERVASLRPFILPGGDAAIRRPAVTAVALLWASLGERGLELAAALPGPGLSESETQVVRQLLRTGVRSVTTTSAGRLFDGVAALLGLWHRVSYEGQAAMALEFLADNHQRGAYPLPVVEAAGGNGAPTQLDWRVTVSALLEDRLAGVDVETISARFHNALVEAIVKVARRTDTARVALSGGCFQNLRLSTGVSDRLQQEGFEVLQHRQVPANDGGISLGQVAIAAAQAGRGQPAASQEG